MSNYSRLADRAVVNRDLVDPAVEPVSGGVWPAADVGRGCDTTGGRGPKNLRQRLLDPIDEDLISAGRPVREDSDDVEPGVGRNRGHRHSKQVTIPGVETKARTGKKVQVVDVEAKRHLSPTAHSGPVHPELHADLVARYRVDVGHVQGGGAEVAVEGCSGIAVVRERARLVQGVAVRVRAGLAEPRTVGCHYAGAFVETPVTPRLVGQYGVRVCRLGPGI